MVYSNGDVSFCENHAPVGNIRDKPFPEIWRSAPSAALRRLGSSQRVLLHQRGVPVAEHRLSAGATGARHWWVPSRGGPSRRWVPTSERSSLLKYSAPERCSDRFSRTPDHLGES